MTITLTQDIVIPCVDAEGKPTFDVTNYGNYWKMLATIVIPQNDRYKPAIRHAFESYIFTLDKLTPSMVQGFIDFVEKHRDICIKAESSSVFIQPTC